MDFNSIKTRFKIVQDSGDVCRAICPCHNDKQASLSISYDSKENKTLMHCHAGCDTRDILKTVGLKMTDLFDKEKIITDGIRTSSKVVAIYKYTDEIGKVIFEKVRFAPKSFSQRRIIGEDIVWGLDAGTYYETFKGSKNWTKKKKKGALTKEFDGIEPVIYNLPEVIKADTVFIVEGEKDADNLIKLGLTATTSFDGASRSKNKQKWREEYNKYFNNKNVILIPDNDDAGIAHMEYIAQSLLKYKNKLDKTSVITDKTSNIIDKTSNIIDKTSNITDKKTVITDKLSIITVKSIKILSVLELNLPPKGDISDWLEAGHTKEELLAIVENTPEFVKENARNEVDILQFNFSDVGNAERLVSIYGNEIRYSPNRGKWLIWSGRHWRTDNDGKAERLAQQVIKKLQIAGEEIPADDEEKENYKKQIKSFVLKSESDSRIKAMLNQAKVLPGIPIGVDDTDKDIFLLNLRNGTLDLRTGKIKQHDKKDYITKLVNIDYNPNASCPNWLNFLNKIFQGDEELINYVQKSVGYSLTGVITEQCFYMLYGNGANGKSTFLKAIEEITGDYADSLKGSSLMIKRNDDGARGDLAKLQGKRFVVTSELNEGQTFDESLLKALTGGDTVPVRFLYGEEFPLKPQFKLWIGTNEKPKVKGTNLGIWRRVRLIPFLYTFKDEEKNENFYEECIKPELSGILNWAIEGCLKWQKEGTEIPDKVKEAINDYRDEMDTIEHFLDDCCLIGDQYMVNVGDLYDRYCEWCEENREHELSSIKFTKKLKEKGYEQDRSRVTRYWKRIGLIAEQQGFKPVFGVISPFEK